MESHISNKQIAQEQQTMELGAPPPTATSLYDTSRGTFNALSMQAHKIPVTVCVAPTPQQPHQVLPRPRPFEARS